MRGWTWTAALLLASALLPAAPQPAAAEEKPARKVDVRHLSAAEVALALKEAGHPRGLRGVIIGNGFVWASGTEVQLNAVAAAIRSIDTATEAADERLLAELRPVHADPEAVRQAVLTLSEAGTARLQDSVVRLEGRKEWVRRARGIAARMEMEGTSVPVTIFADGRRMTLTVPAGTALAIDADRQYDYPRARVIVAPGEITLSAPSGFSLKLRGVRISYNTLETGQEKRLIVEQLALE